MNHLLFWRLDTDSGLFLGYSLKALYLVFFAVAFYAALLCANIFNISAIKTIQLLRVAQAVNFFLTLVCALLLYVVIYSLHLGSLANFVAVFLASFPLALQSIWGVNLEPRPRGIVIVYTFALCLLLAEFSWTLSFWPLPLFVFSLFLTASLYAGLGVVTANLGGRLNSSHSKELALVVVIFLALVIISSRWSG